MKDVSPTTWVDILWYRSFYDVPRLFCVRTRHGYLLFDSSFDVDIDEYSDKYTIKFISAEELMEDDSPDAILEKAAIFAPIGNIKVARDLFDSTLRKQVAVEDHLLAR